MPQIHGHRQIEPDLSPEEFHLFRDLIHRQSGIYLEDDKIDSLRISLVARATLHGCEDYQDYYRRLSTDHHEFVELLGLITINETSFFRFPQQFDVLKRIVIPDIVDKQSPPRSLRIWSAGCSTGEEPYSIAMAADEVLGPMTDVKVQIMGTDVSRKALVMAQNATYGRRTMLNVSPEVIQRYFETVGERYRVRKRIREMVEFGYHNLIKEPYPISMIGRWDVIFCRNVTIYFKIESTRRVVASFFTSLEEGGYLFIGHSETLQMVSDEFTATEVDGVFVYRKVTRQPSRTFQFLTGTPKIEPPGEPGAPARPARRPAGEKIVAEATTLVKESKLDDALPVLESALSEDPNNAKAHLLEGFIYADQGRYDEAIAECQKAIAIEPLLAPARYVLGVIHEQRGEMKEAVSEYRRTVYINADFALAHFKLAGILKGQGDAAGARKAFKAVLTAIEREPTGDWTEFLGGFEPELLRQTCERGLAELAGARR